MIASIWQSEHDTDTMLEYAEDAMSANGVGPALAGGSVAPGTLDGKRIQYSHRLQSLGRLTCGVAHELNNLMTIVGCTMESYHARALTTDDEEELAEIRKAIDRAAALAQQLLSFGRPHAGPAQPLDLGLAIKGLAHTLSCLTGSRVALDFKLPNVLCPIRAASQEVEQVVLNLVINAYDAIADKGRISLEVAAVEVGRDLLHPHGLLPAGRYACLTVRDTGCGMDAESRRRLFEPFYTTKEPGKGTGLGLSIVWDILKRTAGHITVQCAPLEGSRFDVYWPLVQF